MIFERVATCTGGAHQIAPGHAALIVGIVLQKSELRLFPSQILCTQAQFDLRSKLLGLCFTSRIQKLNVVACRPARLVYLKNGALRSGLKSSCCWNCYRFYRFYYIELLKHDPDYFAGMTVSK